MSEREILKELFKLHDSTYREFTAKLIPGTEIDCIIGVRTPQLKLLAKKMVRNKNYNGFINTLPHKYFEENLLHVFILSFEKLSLNEAVDKVEQFLPYIDNWAVCDQFSMKIFAKHPLEVYPLLQKWMKSRHLYVRRFAIVNSMRFFLDNEFEERMLDDVADAITDDYYICMAAAWYFATALAKQYDYVLPFIEKRKLGKTVHNMTIRKAIDSFRVLPEHKNCLRSLRWRD